VSGPVVRQPDIFRYAIKGGVEHDAFYVIKAPFLHKTIELDLPLQWNALAIFGVSDAFVRLQDRSLSIFILK
jgi:hypothetical protein